MARAHRSILSILPAVNLTEIFCFLSARDVAQISIVCKAFRQIAITDTVWRPLCISQFSSTSGMPLGEQKALLCADDAGFRELYALRCAISKFHKNKLSKKHLISIDQLVVSIEIFRAKDNKLLTSLLLPGKGIIHNEYLLHPGVALNDLDTKLRVKCRFILKTTERDRRRYASELYAEESEEERDGCEHGDDDSDSEHSSNPSIKRHCQRRQSISSFSPSAHASSLTCAPCSISSTHNRLNNVTRSLHNTQLQISLALNETLCPNDEQLLCSEKDNIYFAVSSYHVATTWRRLDLALPYPDIKFRVVMSARRHVTDAAIGGEGWTLEKVSVYAMECWDIEERDELEEMDEVLYCIESLVWTPIEV